MSVNATVAPDPVTTKWIPLGGGVTGIPVPVVNGQWVKGVGGAAVWSAITPADVYADSGWLPLTLQSPWVAMGTGGASRAAPSYRKIASVVYLRGSIQGGPAAGGTVFVLPAGFRPTGVLLITGAVYPPTAGSAPLTIGNDGTATIYLGSTWAQVGLDGVTFPAD